MDNQIKKILPLVFLGLSFFLVWQSWQSFLNISVVKDEIKNYKARNAEMEDNLNKIKESAEFVKKNSKKIEKLNFALPDNDNNPNLMANLESTAASNGLFVKEMDFLKPKEKEQSSVLDENGVAREKPRDSHESQIIKLSLNGNYSAFKNFLSAIESNLRIMDIISIGFLLASDEKKLSEQSPNYDFSVQIRTYWQKAASASAGETPAIGRIGVLGNFDFLQGKQFNDLIFPSVYDVKVGNSDQLNNKDIF